MHQKLPAFFFFLFFASTVFSQKTRNKPVVDYVNPFIGTAQDGAGGLSPVVGPPFAMTNFTAQTSENMISRMPYVYDDKNIIGFIATRQPTIWMGDYGYVSLMPGVGELNVLPEKRKLAFSHDDEQASPYYYLVKMKAAGNRSIQTEIAASSRCGFLRFSFPEAEQAHLVVQALNVNDVPEPGWAPRLNSKETRQAKVTSYIHIDKKKREITGYNPDRFSYELGPELPNFKGYFVIQFDKSFDTYGAWDNDSIKPMVVDFYGRKRMGGYISFCTKEGEKVSVKIATSLISLAQARENLAKEIPDWNFDRVVANTKATWQERLSRFAVTGATEDQKAIFYTAIYHTLLFPRELSEYGRYYSAFDDKVHSGVMYTDFSLWDTFRAEHPFLLFAAPDRVNGMVQAMLNMYKQGGRLPMWPNPAETNIMIGTHADPVIADAYIKGFRGYDTKLAWEALWKDASVPPEKDVVRRYADRDLWQGFEAQAGLSWFRQLGYVPEDKTAESVSRTLEYALDDYCVAQMAKAMGKTKEYKQLIQWSKNYRNVYNKGTGFMAPRLASGDWHPKVSEGFTEGSPWTYLFCAMHDVPGLIELMGGKDAFNRKLDSNFSQDHYKHDNEPGHHYIYLYDYSGQPWKTQELARTHTAINYRNQPNGINGNDDCGQMSAWYLFSVMGFYPVTPASGVYAIGAPQFPSISMQYTTGDGKAASLMIIAENFSEQNKYVQKVMLDGKELKTPFLHHADLIRSRTLRFVMGEKPNYLFR